MAAIGTPASYFVDDVILNYSKLAKIREKEGEVEVENLKSRFAYMLTIFRSNIGKSERQRERTLSPVLTSLHLDCQNQIQKRTAEL